MAKKSQRVPTKPSKPTASTATTESREVRAYRAKLASVLGQPLSRQQQRDLQWLAKTERDAAIAEYVAAMPKGDYCDLASRQHKQIDDAARLYDLPLDGPTIDLRAAISGLHDYIAANAPKLRSPTANGEKHDLEDEKLRQQIAKLQIENDRLLILLRRDRGEAIDRVMLAGALSEVVAQMREYGRSFERISPDACKLFNEMVENLANEIESGRLRF